eukprot:gene952-33966_t
MEFLLKGLPHNAANLKIAGQACRGIRGCTPVVGRVPDEAELAAIHAADVAKKAARKAAWARQAAKKAMKEAIAARICMVAASGQCTDQ